MRATIQRVSTAKVIVNDKVIGEIDAGLLIFAGFEDTDTMEDIDWMANKISGLRVFNDDNGVMNLSVSDVQGSLLVISQFTLHASTRKGNRPSYIKAAKPDKAVPLYEKFLAVLKICSNRPVEKGIFGADMKVHLINDGPVTINIDTKNKE